MTSEQATTALQQLTGSQNPTGALRAMVNGRQFTLCALGVSFRFSGSRAANYARIELDEGLDLYNIEFCKIRGMTISHHRLEGIYCDQLQSIFEDHTGLRLSVPRVIGINYRG